VGGQVGDSFALLTYQPVRLRRLATAAPGDCRQEPPLGSSPSAAMGGVADEERDQASTSRRVGA